MTEESEFVLESMREASDHAIEHMEKEFNKIRASKASPSMLNGVIVEYYGTHVPIERTANINTPDPRQIVIQPFDKSTLHTIEKAIMAANLGFNPQNDGELIRINVPPLTEDRRRDLVKRAKAEAENAKVSVRNDRRNANEEARKLKDEGIPEDDVDDLLEKIQEMTNKYIAKIDKLTEVKEKDILTI
ncbi:MAG: ribosome recycling factor [Bacteroidales bacterium]|jgi:ribosome recycling factor